MNRFFHIKNLILHGWISFFLISANEAYGADLIPGYVAYPSMEIGRQYHSSDKAEKVDKLPRIALPIDFKIPHFPSLDDLAKERPTWTAKQLFERIRQITSAQWDEFFSALHQNLALAMQNDEVEKFTHGFWLYISAMTYYEESHPKKLIHRAHEFAYKLKLHELSRRISDHSMAIARSISSQPSAVSPHPLELLGWTSAFGFMQMVLLLRVDSKIAGIRASHLLDEMDNILGITKKAEFERALVSGLERIGVPPPPQGLSLGQKLHWYNAWMQGDARWFEFNDGYEQRIFRIFADQVIRKLDALKLVPGVDANDRRQIDNVKEILLPPTPINLKILGQAARAFELVNQQHLISEKAGVLPQFVSAFSIREGMTAYHQRKTSLIQNCRAAVSRYMSRSTRGPAPWPR